MWIEKETFILIGNHLKNVNLIVKINGMKIGRSLEFSCFKTQYNEDKTKRNFSNQHFVDMAGPLLIKCNIVASIYVCMRLQCMVFRLFEISEWCERVHGTLDPHWYAILHCTRYMAFQRSSWTAVPPLMKPIFK